MKKVRGLHPNICDTPSTKLFSIISKAFTLISVKWNQFVIYLTALTHRLFIFQMYDLIHSKQTMSYSVFKFLFNFIHLYWLIWLKSLIDQWQFTQFCSSNDLGINTNMFAFTVYRIHIYITMSSFIHSCLKRVLYKCGIILKINK